eukprot:gene13409-17810_t
MAGQGFLVTGVDSSPTLISLARTRMSNQEWIVSDMRSLALGRRFDGILAWDSFFHLRHDDQRKMFGIFAAHAAPAAILMFNAGPGHGEVVGAYRNDPLYHASLDAAEYEALLSEFGSNFLAGPRSVTVNCCRPEITGVAPTRVFRCSLAMRASRLDVEQRFGHAVVRIHGRRTGRKAVADDQLADHLLRQIDIGRGNEAGAPVLLGSATPSLESLHNAETGRYRHLRQIE